MDAVAESGGNKRLACLRCGTPMVFLKREDIQLGKHTYFGRRYGKSPGRQPAGDHVRLPGLRAPGAVHLSQRPPETGASETDGALPGIPFYTPGTGPEIKCPQCGKLHPSDDGFCPLCGLPRQEPCPWCGTAFPVTEEVCPRCGRRRNEE